VKKSQKMKIFKIYQKLHNMVLITLSDIISTKTCKSPGKSGGGLQSGNKVSQNTSKNTPEDDLDTFCDIISHLTSKYRPDFLVLRKLLERTGPDFDEH